MSENFNYSLVKNEEGNFAVRSSVKSFNLDHVTDKDIVSFYKSFSSYASFDTGLLPLNGTGLLAVRTAGRHTQIVTQHEAGLYHVNWGSYEGDSSARAYYVAQPYRVVIGDFQDGNLLGARMFYSPYPITNPNNILYHVNLPNINCQGYRGNGVGWICLYHKDDWSDLPFNEKVSRFIERCSGVETYNDQNMSETDGTRFYIKHSKPEYLSDPSMWQQKSSDEGFGWTLDDQLWIPVLVKDMDHQDKHYDDGQPLTLAMAMLGDYQAYYSDNEIPKMYNIISRSDKALKNSDIASLIKMSFASAPVEYIHQKKDDPYNFTVQHRDASGSAVLIPKLFDDDGDSQEWTCSCCEAGYSEEDDEKYKVSPGVSYVCGDCISNYYIYIESADAYYHQEDDDVVFVESSEEYYHCDHDAHFNCHECDQPVYVSGNNQSSKDLLSSITFFDQNGNHICNKCIDDIITSNELSHDKCLSCSKTVITSTGWINFYPQFKALMPSVDSDQLQSTNVTFCLSCSSNYFVCPCGLLKSSKDETMGQCQPTPIDSFDESKELHVTHCCATCVGPISQNQDGDLIQGFQPFNSTNVELVVKKNIYHNIPAIHVSPIAHDEHF